MNMHRVALLLASSAFVVGLSPAVAQAVSGSSITPSPVTAGGSITFTQTCDLGQGGSVFLGPLAGPLANKSYTFAGSSDVRSFPIPASATPGTYPTSLTCNGTGSFAQTGPFDGTFTVVAAQVVDVPVAAPVAALTFGGAGLAGVGVVAVRRRRGARLAAEA